MSRLKNARIVAWEINNATVLAYREHPGNLFDSFNTRTGKQQVVNENQVARQKWRALEEFPNPTLAEIVGDGIQKLEKPAAASVDSRLMNVRRCRTTPSRNRSRSTIPPSRPVT